MTKDYKKELINFAQTLSHNKQKLFFLSILERIFYTYQKFAEGEMRSYIPHLSNIIEKYWDYILNGKKYDFISDDEYDEYDDKYGEYGYYTDEYNILKEKAILLSSLVRQMYYIFTLLVTEDNYVFSSDDYNVAFYVIQEFMEYYFKIDLEILEKEYITSTSFNFKTLEEAESSAYTEFVRTHELYHLEVNREKEDLEYLKKQINLKECYKKYHIKIKKSLFENYWFDAEYVKRMEEYEEEQEDFEEYSSDFCNTHNYTYDAYKRIMKKIRFLNQKIVLQEDEELYTNRAIEYIDLKDYKKAISDLKKAITLNIDYKKAYYFLGTIYNKLKDYKKAICCFNKALKLDTNYVEGYVGRSDSYAYLNEHQKAIDDLSKAIMLNINSAENYYYRAYSYDELGDYKKAIEDLTKAITLKPYFQEAYCNRGYAYNKIGEHQKAIEDLTKSLELKWTMIEPYYARANSYYQLGEYEKAIADYTKAIQGNPKDKVSYSERAKVYRLLGETEKAIADENTAKKLQ